MPKTPKAHSIMVIVPPLKALDRNRLISTIGWVQADAPAGRPDRGRHPALDAGRPPLLRVRPGVERRGAQPVESCDVVKDVVELGLDDVDHRVVPETRVRPDHQAQVGKPGDGRAAQGAHVRVEVRRDVAGAAWVDVVAPGAADGGGPFQNDEVGQAGIPKPDPRAKSAEPRADDGGPDVAGQWVGARTGGSASLRDLARHWSRAVISGTQPGHLPSLATVLQSSIALT